MQITVENHLGQKLDLKRPYQVVRVEGLTPSAATINTSGAGISDGTTFNSSYVNPRNIVITIVPEGNVEVARLALYKYFKPKYNVRLYFKTSMRDVYIDGYVENFEGGLYAAKQAFQISVMCPQPFFIDMAATVIPQTFVRSNFHFPVSIPEEGSVISSLEIGENIIVPNKGEESTGIVIKLVANNTVLEPTIYNTITRETFTFEYEMQTGDVVEIDTRKGHKTITLLRNGVVTNIINSIAKGSKWFTIPAGDNKFTYTCVYGAENLQVEYVINPLYGGV